MEEEPHSGQRREPLFFTVRIHTSHCWILWLQLSVKGVWCKCVYMQYVRIIYAHTYAYIHTHMCTHTHHPFFSIYAVLNMKLLNTDYAIAHAFAPAFVHRPAGMLRAGKVSCVFFGFFFGLSLWMYHDIPMYKYAPICWLPS